MIKIDLIKVCFQSQVMAKMTVGRSGKTERYMLIFIKFRDCEWGLRGYKAGLECKQPFDALHAPALCVWHRQKCRDQMPKLLRYKSNMASRWNLNWAVRLTVAEGRMHTAEEGGN